MTGIPPAGDEILFSGETLKGGVIFVLGSTDRGKTTLCRRLVDRSSRAGKAAYLDLDPGQSTIGPPATLGLAFYLDGVELPGERVLRFAGSTSPRGHLLPILTGAKRLLERALAPGAATVVVDSPGYIHDDAAVEFHLCLVDLLQPDVLVAIQEKEELEPILAHFRGHSSMEIHRILPSPLARPRGSAERRRYREGKFREYFAGACSQELPLEGIGVHGRVPDTHHPEHWQGLLAALCGPEQWIAALGIIESIDISHRVLHIRAPGFEPGKITSVDIGTVRMGPAEG